MTDDDLDRMIRQTMPDVTVDQDRLDRLMSMTMDALPLSVPRLSWRERLQRLRTQMSPLWTYVLPVVLAGWLGVTVGAALLPPPVLDAPWAAVVSSASPFAAWEM